MQLTVFLLLIAFFSFTQTHNYQSQSGQDRYLHEHFFNNKQNGTFVEIGAHDGKTYSNTYFFEKSLNWRGICIEPQPNIFEQLKQNRSCILVNKCVGNKIGYEEFIWIHNGGTQGEYTEMLSGLLDTMDPRHLDRMHREIAQYGGSLEIIKVPVTTLNHILEENNMWTVDYLSIDTEGSELEILQAIDFDRFYIRFMSVENNYASTEIRTFLESIEFSYITTLDNCDEIYCNNRELPTTGGITITRVPLT